MDLLETLSRLLNCQYISDLPHATMNQEQRKEILRLSESDFSLDAYEEAARYVTGNQKLCCKTAQEAKDAVLVYLSSPAPRR